MVYGEAPELVVSREMGRNGKVGVRCQVEDAYDQRGDCGDNKDAFGDGRMGEPCDVDHGAAAAAAAAANTFASVTYGKARRGEAATEGDKQSVEG